MYQDLKVHKNKALAIKIKQFYNRERPDYPSYMLLARHEENETTLNAILFVRMYR